MSGKPIAILHGWGGSFATTFGAVWHRAIIESGRLALVVDLPGHANADASTEPKDYADLASATSRLLPDEPIDAVGFSLGGKIALALALAEPGRFGRLVIGGVGDNIFAPEPAGEELAQALVDGIGPTTSAHVRDMVEYSVPSGSAPRALAAVLRRPPNPRFTSETLSLLAVPTLVVNGTNDVVATPDGRLLAASPLISSVRLTGVGHVALPHEPRFIQQTLSFLTADDRR